MSSAPVAFDRERVEHLLSVLDERLRLRGIAASEYVVGGVAIALTVDDSRRTADIDALASDRAVLEEARSLAESVGLPPYWLNENARPWIPPRPEEALRPPKAPGLVIQVAPARHLLAMKLVAGRRQDTADVLALVDDLGMRRASAQDFADLLVDVYDGEDMLGDVLRLPGGQAEVDAEALSIGRWVVAQVALT